MRAYACLGQTLPRRQWRDGVNPRVESTAIEQRLVDADVRASRHVLNARDSEFRGMMRSGSGGCHLLVKAVGRFHLPNETHCRIFQNAGWFSVLVANDHAARWIQRLACHTRKFESGAVRECHVTVETADEYRPIGCESVDQFFGWQLRVRPKLVIPVAAGYPTSFWQARPVGANSRSKLLRRIGVAQVDARELETAAKKMRVSVIETREHQTLVGVDCARFRARQLLDLFCRTN